MWSQLRTGFLFAFLILSCFAFGQDKPQYSVFLIDSSLLENADAVIRTEETRYTIRNLREYMCEITKVVTILSAESGETQLRMPYGKYSTAELVQATIYDAFGNVLRKIKKSELLDVAAYDGVSILSSERITGIDVSGGRLPFTIEYSWRLIYHETMYYPEWSPQMSKVSIEKASFILEAPENLVIHTRMLNYDFGYVSEKLNGRHTQTWQLSNHPAIEKEISGPPAHELFPLVILSPSVFTVENYTGSMSDWKSFGAFLYELNKGKEKMPAEMTERIRQLTASCQTRKEKIDTLYRWLQQNMRYVSIQLGIGGWQSFDAAYVEKNRYGDCKALSTFMRGMLQEAGIESWEASIKAAEEEMYYHPDFAFPDFNHVMLYVPDEDLWLECTSNFRSAGEITQDEENKIVLLSTPDGGKIVRTPLSERGTNQVHTVDTIWITDHIRLKGQKSMHGHAQDEIRSDYYYASAEDQRKNFLEGLPIAVSKLEQFQLDVDQVNRESSSTYNATLRQYGNSSGVRYFLPVSSMYPLPNICPATKERKSDYLLRYEYIETNETYISIPPGYTIEYLPTTTALDYDRNNFALEITAENNFLHIHQFRKDIPMRLTPVQYVDWCSYLNNVSKAKNQMIVLKKED